MAPKSSIALASVLALLMGSAVMRVSGIEALGGQGVAQEGHQYEDLGGLGGFLTGLTGGASALGGGVLGGLDKKIVGEGLEKKSAEKELAKEGGFLGVKGPVELVKLLLNPLELLGKIAAFYKLEKLGLVEAVSKGVTFGIEVALQPALISIKIIERVFVPDACRLKFICELGKPIQALKGTIPKFSPGFLDGASTLKAFSDGVLGHECEHLYPCGGELKLKKDVELLQGNGKQTEAHGGHHDEAFAQGGQHGEHDGERYGGQYN